MPRDVQIQVRVSEEEAALLHKKGERLAEKFSGIKKLDGSINISAVVRHLALKGHDGA